ncbi:MAG: double-strand break repair protein AddB, partial [Pseudomonadota bacterium]
PVLDPMCGSGTFLIEAAEIAAGLHPGRSRQFAFEQLAWRTDPPRGALIIAGSTGSTPASLTLMQAALELPRGRVVLPGLDTDASPQDWDAIAGVANHHQSALAATLKAFGTPASTVPTWPTSTDAGADAARNRLIHEALAPADLTGDWRERIESLAAGQAPGAAVAEALSGFTLIEADDEAHEAQLAALLLRAGLETGDGHIALVTPDMDLARRVTALMQRWSVDVEPSAGMPLMRTGQGLALSQVLAWWQAPDDPVHVAALVKSPLLAEPLDGADRLERNVLRGPKRWTSLAGLAARCEPGSPERALVETLAAATEAASGPAQRSGLDWAEALAGLVQALGLTEPLWRGQAGQAAAKLIDDTASLLDAFADHTLAVFAEMVAVRAAGVVVAPATPGHPRLSIWGPLEARLQSADHLVLAGLNEDVWPHRPGADPFLPAHFKAALGLPDPEERMGLMAHDFAGLACAPKVTCLYAQRRGDAPAVGSRWIWRLKTLVKGAGADGALDPAPGTDPRPWADALWAVPEHLKKPSNFAEPRPKPPLEARPARLSVTRIDWLQRDPYAIYAQSVLRLSPLDPLAKPIGPAERGTAIHAALEKVGKGQIPAETEALSVAIEAALADAGMEPAALAASGAVTRQTAAWCLDWLAGRAPQVSAVDAEVRGQLDFTIAGASFALSATADRIERLGDGLAILDFKTGAPPSNDQIEAGLAQQMPLQALIAQSGGFAGVASAPVTELVYVAFKAKPSVSVISADPAELVVAAKDGLTRLIAAYRNPDQAFPSAPRVQFVGYDYGYNRLARRAEWMAETSDE